MSTNRTIRFPEWMRRQQDAWLERPNGKLACSFLDEKPVAYVPDPRNEKPGSWRFRWNQRPIGGSFEAASAFLGKHPDHEGLTFRIHPFGSTAEQVWPVCLDFDDGIAPDGKVWGEVQAAIDVLELASEVFVEYSRSRTGVHVFLLTRCTPFRNIYQAPVNKHCRCDILFSNPVAVTGDVYDQHFEMTEVPFACLETLPFFKHKPRVVSDDEFDFDAEWWGQPEEPLPERFDFLRNHMEHWNGGRAAAKHNGRSNATFSAACHLLRSGVVGWQALRLLELFQTDPPFEESELQHKLEGAYHAVAHQRATEPLTEFD